MELALEISFNDFHRQDFLKESAFQAPLIPSTTQTFLIVYLCLFYFKVKTWALVFFTCLVDLQGMFVVSGAHARMKMSTWLTSCVPTFT